MKKIEEQKKPPFWNFYFKNTWLLQLFLILGTLVIIKLKYSDPDSMSGIMTPVCLGVVFLINVIAVIGSFVSWKKKP